MPNNADSSMNPPEQRDDSSGWMDVDFHVSDTYRALDEAFAELWNDPAMADYDHYEELKNQIDALRN